MGGKVIVERVLKSSDTFGGQVPPHKAISEQALAQEALNAVISDFEALGSVRASTIKLCRRARAALGGQSNG